MHPRTLCLILTITFPVLGFSQSKPQVVHLWENGAPGFESRKDEPETSKDWWFRNIHNPSITVFLPPKEIATGCAVIVAPGGGFKELVFNAEGVEAAEYLTTLGVTVFALKYRLPFETNSPYTLDNVRQDAYRAVRLVRSRAKDFGIDPNRIGMLGFSAGGAVAMMVSLDKGDGAPRAPDPIDRANGRPNFQMLIYPGGKVPKKIPSDAPPTFLLCANDDEYGCDEITLELLMKFRSAKVPVEAHLLARGKHAFNMGHRSEYSAVKTWPSRMEDWMRDSGFLATAPATGR